MTARPLVLDAPDVRLTIDPDLGARMTSLVVGGHELLVTEGYGDIRWGSYPMAPFAGRIREGRFTFEGREVSLPRNMEPHAIHGTVFVRPWTVVGPDALTIDLGADWPFRGRVHQRFSVRADGLDVEMTLEADERMPASIGWHPWFRRVLAGTVARPRPPSAPVVLDFDADRMWAKGPDEIPTGELVPPGPHPWDDCFTALRSMPSLTWPGVMRLELRSEAEQWVVYEPPEAVCVEPQTAPPDFVRVAPAVVEPGRPLRATMTWRWWPDERAAD